MHSWRVPEKPADAYVVELSMEADPFEIDATAPSVIEKADLMLKSPNLAEPSQAELLPLCMYMFL